MMKKIVVCLCIMSGVLVFGTAPAFTLGDALQKLNDPEMQKNLGIGKKMLESSQEISEPQEIEIGEGITSRLLGAAPLVHDDALQKYVNRIGLWLALQSERPGLPWRFGVTNDADVNAFATPGGSILITRGLYMKFRNEAELAGVLAHEISHVVQKHQLKAIKSALGREWQTDLAATYAEKKGSGSAKTGLKAFTAGTELFARGLDKEDEFEADRMGVVIAARAGYNPFGLAGTLQTLDAVSPGDGAVALMFKTHPSPAKRLEMLGTAMGTQMDQYGDTGKDPARFYKLTK